MINRKRHTPKWREFEHLVYQLQQQLSEDAEVVLDTVLLGEDSKTNRQIDILVKRFVGQYLMIIVMECKDYKKPVDVKEVEAFATKLKDVKANKGALVSAKGFSQAALETAKRHGIDMFRFIDTQNTNWKAYASISASVEQILFQGMKFRFSGFTQIPIVFINSPENVTVFSAQKEPLGILKDLMIKKWIDKEIPRIAGIHVIEIVNGGYVGMQEDLFCINIQGVAHIEKKVFHGPLPVDFVGFKNEQNGGILTRSFTTDMLEVDKLTEGQLDGWSEVDPSEIVLQPMLTFFVEHGLGLTSLAENRSRDEDVVSENL